jgi:DNA-binding NtrC family response regulator
MNSDFAVRENLTRADKPHDVAARELTVPEQSALGPMRTLRSQRAAAEVLAIRYALQETGNNRKRAAQLLSISYRSLLYKLRQYGIAAHSEDQRT